MKLLNIKSLLGCLLLTFLISCKIEPQAIEYGKDQCSFCVMNIVDKTHSAQYVTKKGKQFKFDAIECMVLDILEKGEENIQIKLVANYGNPGEMVDANTSTYLISEEIKSPMGANLSAFSTLEMAKEFQTKYTGNIFSWSELKQKMSDR